jgi:hypothetical protein
MPAVSALNDDQAMSLGLRQLNDDSAEAITKQLTARNEWIGFLVQAAALGTSSVVDRVTDTGRLVLAGLTLIHAALAIMARVNRRGPFSYGRLWGPLWLSSTTLMPLLMARLVTPGEYGSSPACVQACGYASGPLLIFAFFPWGFPGKRWERRYMEILTLAVLVLEPLIVIYTINRSLSTDNWRSVFFSALWIVLAYLAGKEIKKLCAAAAAEQFSLLDEAYRRLREFFHGEISTTMRSVEELGRRGDLTEITERLGRLKRRIDGAHLDVRLARERVDVYAVLRDTVDVARPGLQIEADVPPGSLLVRQSVGWLLKTAADDLLENVSKHGAAPARLTLALDHDTLFLIVGDQGGGLSPDHLDTMGTSLFDLRERVRELGGEILVLRPNGRWSTRVMVYVPVFGPA